MKIFFYILVGVILITPNNSFSQSILKYKIAIEGTSAVEDKEDLLGKLKAEVMQALKDTNNFLVVDLTKQKQTTQFKLIIKINNINISGVEKEKKFSIRELFKKRPAEVSISIEAESRIEDYAGLCIAQQQAKEYSHKEIVKEGQDREVIFAECCKSVLKKMAKDISLFTTLNCQDIPWQGKIITITQDAVVYINAGLECGIREGQIFDVYKVGQELIDPDTGLYLGKEEEHIGVIQICSVKRNLSQAKVLRGKGGTAGDIVRVSGGFVRGFKFEEMNTLTKEKIAQLEVAIMIMQSLPGVNITVEEELVKLMIEAGFRVVDVSLTTAIKNSKEFSEMVKNDTKAMNTAEGIGANLLIIGAAEGSHSELKEEGGISALVKLKVKIFDILQKKLFLELERVGSSISPKIDTAYRQASFVVAWQITREFCMRYLQEEKQSKE